MKWRRRGEIRYPLLTCSLGFLLAPSCLTFQLQTHAEPQRRLKICPELRDTAKGQREGVDFAESGAGLREKQILLRQRDRCEEGQYHRPIFRFHAARAEVFCSGLESADLNRKDTMTNVYTALVDRRNPRKANNRRIKRSHHRSAFLRSANYSLLLLSCNMRCRPLHSVCNMRFFSLWVLGLALASSQWSTKLTRVSERARRRRSCDEAWYSRFIVLESSHLLYRKLE